MTGYSAFSDETTCETEYGYETAVADRQMRNCRRSVYRLLTPSHRTGKAQFQTID
jgi:hypothetical protein